MIELYIDGFKDSLGRVCANNLFKLSSFQQSSNLVDFCLIIILVHNGREINGDKFIRFLEVEIFEDSAYIDFIDGLLLFWH